MKCERCTEPSRVYLVESLSSPLLVSEYFWDENGIGHTHNPNTYTTSFKCSGGHEWLMRQKRPCDAEGCTYNET